MSSQIQFDSNSYIPRWVSYLDLLGFEELVRTKGWIHVFSYYTKAIENLIKDFGFNPKIEKVWFSDTLLLYSPDDTGASFSTIDAETRRFINSLILDDIPVRGAMACGGFYADKGEYVFFGQAFIEAYHYGENQDWIGFVLSPSAVKQMGVIGLPKNNTLNYAYWNIPYKKIKKDDVNLQESLPAYIMHDSVNGRNRYLDKMRAMKGRLKDNRLIRKYENTISFIEENKRTLNKSQYNIQE